MPDNGQKGDYIVLDNHQAAALFRLSAGLTHRACQYEGGRMRWWLPQGLLLELWDIQWRLSVVPTRNCQHDADDLPKPTGVAI